MSYFRLLRMSPLCCSQVNLASSLLEEPLILRQQSIKHHNQALQDSIMIQASDMYKIYLFSYLLLEKWELVYKLWPAWYVLCSIAMRA